MGKLRRPRPLRRFSPKRRPGPQVDPGHSPPCTATVDSRRLGVLRRRAPPPPPVAASAVPATSRGEGPKRDGTEDSSGPLPIRGNRRSISSALRQQPRWVRKSAEDASEGRGVAQSRALSRSLQLSVSLWPATPLVIMAGCVSTCRGGFSDSVVQAIWIATMCGAQMNELAEHSMPVRWLELWKGLASTETGTSEACPIWAWPA